MLVCLKADPRYPNQQTSAKVSRDVIKTNEQTGKYFLADLAYSA